MMVGGGLRLELDGGLSGTLGCQGYKGLSGLRGIEGARRDAGDSGGLRMGGAGREAVEDERGCRCAAGCG